MTPRHPIVPDRRTPLSRRVGAIMLLILLACGAAGADPTSTDSLPAPPGGTSAPSTIAGAAPSALHHPMGGVFRADRVVHASFALAIGTGVGLSSREPAIGAGTVIALAVAKELLDDRFDRGDLAAGAVGAGLAWLVVTALTR